MTPNLMSERVLKNTIVMYARRYGWLVHHDLPSQRANGSWSTAVQGDSGFPDLVLVHPGNPDRHSQAQIIYAELKTQRGKLTTGQQQWLDALQASCQTAVVWRPNDLQDIFTKLRTPLLY